MSLNNLFYHPLYSQRGKKNTECFLIAAQNNAIRTNYIKARIDKMQQNSKYMLYGDRDEMINDMIIECNKLAQKEYRT